MFTHVHCYLNTIYISPLSDQTHWYMDLVNLEEVQGQFGLMMLSAQERRYILISAYSEVWDSQIEDVSIRCNGKLTKEKKQNVITICLFV